MVKWVEIGDCKLALGDCRDILPTLGPVGKAKANPCLLTDPPYGIDYGRSGGFSAAHGWGQWRGNVSWDQERPARDIFDAMLACTDEQIIWGGNYFTDFLPPSMQWLVWDKGQREFSLADCEFAWSSQQKAARIFSYSRPHALRDGREHPTQKPIELMKWCLGFLPAKATILDPFMGSGTTGVACALTDRSFIGIEREPSYFDIACRRIEEAYKQPRLFAEPPPKPVQPSLLGDAA